jgi:hypothetical protein
MAGTNKACGVTLTPTIPSWNSSKELSSVNLALLLYISGSSANAPSKA